MKFMNEVIDFLNEYVSGNKCFVVDKIMIDGLCVLESVGLEVFSGEEFIEKCCVVKGFDEIFVMCCVFVVCEVVVKEMEDFVCEVISGGGVFEDDVWVILYKVNIE